jgi:hypothetical protein
MRQVVVGPVAAVLAFLVGVGAVMLIGIWTFEPVGETVVQDAVSVPPFEGTQTLEYWAPSCSRHGEGDEAGVYRAVLSNARYTGRTIVVQEMSSRGGELMNKIEQVRGVSGEAIRDYKLRNIEPESLRWIGSISPRIEFLSEDEIDRIFPENASVYPWTDFYKRFPGSSGLVTLSNVGFNGDHTQALVYFANVCGGLCGSGEFVVLKKVRGRWVVERTDQLWVS